MILFIHGFGSSGRGSKAAAMRQWCQSQYIPFLAPSLPTIPELALETLSEIITQWPGPMGLIGSSLGGYYAHILALKHQKPVVLINPAVEPYETLKRALGIAVNYYDNSEFEWRDSYLATLKQYSSLLPSVLNEKQCWLLIQSGDEILDYRQALPAFPLAKVTLEQGGNHGFVGFERYVESITKFLLPS